MTVVRYRFGSSCGDGPDETDDSRTGQRRFYRRLPRLSDARPRPPTVRRVSFSPLYFHPTTVRNGKHESHTTTVTCVVLRTPTANVRPSAPVRRVYEVPRPPGIRLSHRPRGSSSNAKKPVDDRPPPPPQSDERATGAREPTQQVFPRVFPLLLVKSLRKLKTAACPTIETGNLREFQS